jgi:hypothetical protein
MAARGIADITSSISMEEDGNARMRGRDISQDQLGNPKRKV